MGCDAVLIGGSFFDDELPAGKDYLLHYFSKPIPRRLLIYYFKFPSLAELPSKLFHRMFSDHTGVVVSLRYTQTLLRRINIIERMNERAAAALDFDMLHRIKSGGLNISELS